LETDEPPAVRPAPATRRFGTASSPDEWARAAAGGTLYVDEITALPPHAQVALGAALRQDGTAAPRFRLVCASRVPAEQLVATRLLRDDFFYLASVVSCVPPLLRSRGDDVLLLAQMFLQETARRLGRQVEDISPAARRLLTSYRWPGNVSELRAVMEHAVAVSRETKLEPADLPARVRDVGTEGDSSSGHGEIHLPAEGLDLRRTLEAIENTLLQQALDRTGWNKQRAAALLGLNRTTLVEMLKRKRMSRPTSERKMAS
jgi:DNA-binding NtrC family response regulator